MQQQVVTLLLVAPALSVAHAANARHPLRRPADGEAGIVNVLDGASD